MAERDALTAAAVVAEVEGRWGNPCGGCRVQLVGHEVVLSLLLGMIDDAACCTCLAARHAREPRSFLEQARANVRQLDCYRAGWEHSDRRLLEEGPWPEERIPGSMRLLDAEPAGGTLVDGVGDTPRQGPVADEFDAGDAGCGELVLDLRRRMLALAPGQLLRLIARDPGAPQDLPAWCRLTGHRLREATPPVYVIERKPD